ncbi:class I SAM-dependent methyltransferase [Mucilaginibacter sp. AW1-3]
MNNHQFQKIVQALNWEAIYKKRFAGEVFDRRKFLAIEGSIDPDFARFIDNPDFAGCTVLDIGTGTGEQATYLAKKGFKVTATDVSALAINYAKQQAVIQSAPVEFIVDNILFTHLTRQFDMIIDRGCYSVIPVTSNLEYLQIVKKLLKPGGRFLIKVELLKIKKMAILQEDADLQIEFFEETFYKNINGLVMPTAFFALRNTGAV